MAAMVAGMAVAEPEANVAITEMSGGAKVTWGVDLDEGTTGFKNDVWGTFKLNLVDGGSKSTEGEGVWAELKFKTDGDTFYKSEGSDSSVQLPVKWIVDTAKLHFYNFYVGILSGDTTVGNLHIDSAVETTDGNAGGWQGDHDYWLTDVNASKSQGLVLGYGDNKNFGVEFDFRSQPLTGDTDFYTNDYGLAGEVKLLDSNEFLNGLFATVGGSLAFNDPNDFGLAAAAGYKAKINDTFYFKPVVGWTATGDWNGISENGIAGGLLLGWGDTTSWGYTGLWYLNEARDDGSQIRNTPGVGVVAYLPITKDGVSSVEITPSFFTGSIVPGLSAAALADITIPTTDGAKLGFGVVGGVKYDVKATDSVTVTPQVNVRYANATYVSDSGHAGCVILNSKTDNGGAKNDAAATDGLLNIKGGVDVSGLINNTTVGVYYLSRNLLADTNKAGTINVYAQISF